MVTVVTVVTVVIMVKMVPVDTQVILEKVVIVV